MKRGVEEERGERRRRRRRRETVRRRGCRKMSAQRSEYKVSSLLRHKSHGHDRVLIGCAMGGGEGVEEEEKRRQKASDGERTSVQQ